MSECFLIYMRTPTHQISVKVSTNSSQVANPWSSINTGFWASIDGFHGTFYHGNWRALHHHAACWLVNIHITWLFCPPVTMVKNAMLEGSCGMNQCYRLFQYLESPLHSSRAGCKSCNKKGITQNHNIIILINLCRKPCITINCPIVGLYYQFLRNCCKTLQSALVAITHNKHFNANELSNEL